MEYFESIFSAAKELVFFVFAFLIVIVAMVLYAIPIAATFLAIMSPFILITWLIVNGGF